MRNIKKITALIMLSALICACGSGNREYVEERAETRWNQVGYRIIGYEGYQWGFWFGPYGGAAVWYQLETTTPNGVRYTGFLYRWGNEIHVYGPKAVDAIKPN